SRAASSPSASACACSASERSSARKAAKGVAAASQSVVSSPNSRCWSSSVRRSPEARAMLPRDGSSLPAARLNSVVLPVPFLPRMPQRSPRDTVNVTSSKIVIPPRSMPTPLNAICVIVASGAVRCGTMREWLRATAGEAERNQQTHQRNTREHHVDPVQTLGECGTRSGDRRRLELRTRTRLQHVLSSFGEAALGEAGVEQCAERCDGDRPADRAEELL